VQNLPIQPYDILTLVVLIAAAVYGACKGMAWQVASIASMVVSSVVAMRFSAALAPQISNQEPWNRFLAMAILFALTSLVIWVAFRWVSGIINRMKLKEFDRQMGALFGLAKGILFCLVITFFAVTLSESGRQAVLRSRSGYYTALLVQRGTPLMPQEVRDVLGKYIDQLDRRLDPNAPPLPPSSPSRVASELPEPAGGEGGTSVAERPRAWDPQLWRQEARDALNNQVNQQVDQWGRQLDQRIDQAERDLRGRSDQGVDRVNRQLDRQFSTPAAPPRQ